jgi:hypothetical protein
MGGLESTAVAGGHVFDVDGLRPAIGALTLEVTSDTGACGEGELEGPGPR